MVRPQAFWLETAQQTVARVAVESVVSGAAEAVAAAEPAAAAFEHDTSAP